MDSHCVSDSDQCINMRTLFWVRYIAKDIAIRLVYIGGDSLGWTWCTVTATGVAVPDLLNHGNYIRNGLLHYHSSKVFSLSRKTLQGGRCHAFLRRRNR